MKFLINMNLPRELGRRLSNLGHDCRHVGDVGLSDASDEAIVEAARKAGETILTHDLDYGSLLAFSGEPSPSVVIFRLRNIRQSSPGLSFQAIPCPRPLVIICIINGAEDMEVRIKDG